ncbi:MAG: ABC-F family ATP-binding cassette domain-containing protein [Clostridium sp.]|uniref:ABC-F family ATP-binding cassette domain-containing protein n=1 Tax=Clostridium sp. TaxID=1506 RepID=UPI0025C25125|nr:ABC-F family ATP-binding cassette domain-containing protein [Clostridium sp.]MBS4955569.1 ABC-F family ATP-binding cassette domain-containing protein [Clostridium sp.]
MNLLNVENISKTYSEKILLNNVSFGINEGDKIGIIGLNGSGKSTLLKIVTGKDEFFDGLITKGKGVRVEYLEQNSEFDSNATVLQQIFKGDTREMKLLMEYEELLEKVSSNSFNEEDNNKLIKIQEKIDALNLWNLESEVKVILNKLGITDYTMKMGTLSGGQKKRVFLASALIKPCELLVLDEPTNHLDSDSIEWLEEYLNSRKGALLMITHDRYFLDRVSNKILELDRGNIYQYLGNYSDFLEKKAERLEIEAASEEKRQKLIIKELQWVRRGAKARTTKQKARLQRFDDLVNQDYIAPKPSLEMSFIGTRLGKKIIELHDISKSYGEKNLINKFNYTILKEDRIGIIGDNGVGKTTLLNIIKGSINPDNGDREVGETVKIATFTQDDSHMDLSMKAIDYIKEGGEWIPTDDGSKISASQLAERFLFDGTMQYTMIEKLSGGERRRLHLLRVLMEAPNVLILDEPTNDLDIETLKILEDFIDEFVGVVIVVSHDRYFLDRICNKIFSFENKGLINIYNGNYSDYLINKEIKFLKEKEEQSSKDDNTKKKEYVKNKDERPKFTFKEQKEFENIYNDIEAIEMKIAEIEEEMNKNSSSYGLLNELDQEKTKLEEELLEKYERQEYLEDIARRIEEYNNNKS